MYNISGMKIFDSTEENNVNAKKVIRLQYLDTFQKGEVFI